MIGNNGHIVSKFSWNTSFDRKDKGGELQNRLSSWSRLAMPGEVAGIFDNLCPPGQVWHIPSLQIDLGKIDYADLEPELSARLYKQLYEQLTDLILNSDNKKDQIEIFDQYASEIRLIRHFLEHGFIPWYYEAPDQAINPLMAHQLETNRHEVIAMLRETGATHENVRRRIAWQVSEANVIEIIKGLEPNNHEQVSDFSNEMIRVQQEETIVQGGLADFKKNLLFFILNYLLTERGTIFNKIAFVESNIRQMAEHYHISYRELTAMIGRAVDNVEQCHKANTCIITLKTLVAKSRTEEHSELSAKARDIDFWGILKTSLGSFPPLANVSKAELNDMVTGLAAEDKRRLKELIVLSAGDDRSLSAFVQKLNDSSLMALFATLGDHSGSIAAESILLMNDVLREQKITIGKQFLWEAGLKFLIVHDGSDFTVSEFLIWMTDQISRKKQIDKLRLLEQFLISKTLRSARAGAGFEIYTGITSVFVAELSSGSQPVIAGIFGGILHRLNDLLRTGSDRNLFISFKKIAAQYIRYNPQAALGAFTLFTAKQELERLLPYILDDRLANWLTKNAGKHVDESINAVRLAVNILAADKRIAAIASWIEDNLVEFALNLAVFSSASRLGAFSEALLGKMAESARAPLSAQFELFVAKLATCQKANPALFPADFVQAALKTQSHAEGLSVADQIVLLMNKPGKQAEAGKLLSVQFTDRQFATLRKRDDLLSAAILDYLLPGGKRLKFSLVKEYTGLLGVHWPNTSESRIRSVLRELFWQCIVNYAHHGGRAETLTQSFEAAVAYRFQLQIKSSIGYDSVSARPNQKRYQLANNEWVSAENVVSLVDECFASGRDSVTRNGTSFRFDDLLTTIAGADHEATRRIVNNIALSEEAISLIGAALSFEHFSMLVANASPGKIYEAISALRSLHQFVHGIAPGAMSGDLAAKYWKQLWAIIITGSLQAAELKNLLQTSLDRLADETHADSEFIISEIRKRHHQFTPVLRAAFADYMPAPMALPGKTIPPLSRKLKQVKQRGMLHSLAYHLIALKQVPQWFGSTAGQTVGELLREIVIHHPVNIMLVLHGNAISGRQMAWLSETVDFETLAKSLGELNRAQQSAIDNLVMLYQMLGQVIINGTSAKEMRCMIFRKLIKAWTSNNWKIISAENIWNELAWSISVEYGINRKQFIAGIENSGAYLPPALRISFGHLKEQDKSNSLLQVPAALPPIKKIVPKSKLVLVAKDGIPLKNAGLVLINNYVTMLFERLGIVQDQAFAGVGAQEQAVHYLQYVVTGLTRTEEHLLPLNKVLCGVPLAHAVPDRIEIPEAQRKMIEGLITAMIDHWPSIGNSSVGGFRGNWLVRNGLLTELDERWELKVEKRAYDILLQQSPFSFSIIKYPWMYKPMHVNWPY